MLATEIDNQNMGDLNEYLLPGLNNGANFDFDIENPFSQNGGDILQQLTNDLEIPMLLEEDEGCGGSPSPPPSHSSSNSSCTASAPLLTLDDEVWFPKLEDLNMDTIAEPVDWGADIPVELLDSNNDWNAVQEVKLEPHSPPLCDGSVLPPSPSGSSSSSDSGVHCWLNSVTTQPAAHTDSTQTQKMVLDTPPVSPPRDATPPSSPQPNVVTTMPPATPLMMVSPVNLLSVSQQAANGAGLLFSTGQKMKRLKIQPRPIKLEQPETVVPSCGVTTSLPLGPRIKVVPKQELMNGGELSSVWSPRLVQDCADIKLPIPAIPSRSYTVQPGQQNTIELKLLKKHQRMIKNRESACQSRRKKKEYVTSLEAELDGLRQENLRLKQDNSALRERLSQLEGSGSRGGVSLRTGKGAVTALFVMLFVVSLNVGPFSRPLNGGGSPLLPLEDPDLPLTPPLSSDSGRAHSGRSLLWAASILPDSINSSTNNQPTCPVHINQTESRRLDSELRGWFEEELGRSNNTTAVTEVLPLLLPPSPPPPLKRKPRRKRPVRRKVPMVSSSPGGEVALYSGPHRYAELMDAIRLRDDTFYVVSLSGDHLLLPARSHNHTLRPKVSLVMPTNLPANGSIPRHHVAMMQIDCEVTDTRLIHVDEAYLPPKLRSNSSQAPPTSPSPAPEVNQKTETLEQVLSKSNYDPAMHYKTHKALFHHSKDFP